jgi:NADP-reducing hydrogenase subunit HndD
MAKITINGELVKVKNGTTILNAAKGIGIDIPTLCFIKEINEIGFCRICVVEVEGEQDLISSCNTEVANGMVIYTDSDKVIESRTATLQLLASKHRFDCWRCPKDGMCEFYDLLKIYDVVFEEFGPGIGRNKETIIGTGISQDQSKCVLCKRCVAVCQNVITANVLKFRDDDGMNPIVSPTPGLSFDESGCIFCGQCVKTCPTGTLFETDHTKEVKELLKNKEKFTVAQVSKEAISALAEEFGYDLGTDINETFGKTMQALKLLGFDEVSSLDFGVDLHNFETGKELVKRIEEGNTLPIFTSTCPSFTRYLELYKPQLLENLSTVKTPHIIQGMMYKHNLLHHNHKNIAVVTIDGCTAKKYEVTREELKTNDAKDVDAVLTVRELAKMLKVKGINYRSLENIEFTNEITGTSPSVKSGSIVSTLNVVSELLDNKPIENIEFKVTRGKENIETVGQIREASILIAGNKLNVAICTGGAAFAEMFEKLEKKKYHLVEFMTCPGGCLNGGGMPIAPIIPMHEVIQKRNKALCSINEDLPMSNPTHNEFVKSIYTEKITPNLHTNYSQKEFTKE